MKRLVFIFFYVLCIYFLNSSCARKQAETPTPPVNFTPPVILSDYNSGSLFTNLGGMSGGDEELPGTAFPAVIMDDGFTMGNSGFSAMLDYDVSRPGEYSFYWIKLGKEIGRGSGVTKPLDIRHYNYLSFWIKGQNSGEEIKLELHQDIDDDERFVFGKDITSFVYVTDYLPEGRIAQAWQKALIPLKDFTDLTDISKMIELVFVFENKKGDTKGAVYIDDILFGLRPDDILSAEYINEIQPPVESSFKVNGKSAKFCPAFEASNELTIKAESLAENPFIESVRFEYSIDGGYVWRAIGADYGAGKDIYNVKWVPGHFYQSRDYKVRAVAIDIFGNQKETGTLIECGVKPPTDQELIDLIQRKAFDFFLEHQNAETGLFADTTGGGDASIASTGFGITALIVGAERGWITKDEARKRAALALDAFLPKSKEGETLVEGKYGFFYHFVNMHNGRRAGKSEISTVDTAILICGAITAGEYFGEEIKEKAEELYERAEWDKFLLKEDGPRRNIFSMGWSPEKGILDSYWDFYTDEIILISLLAIGSPTYAAEPDVFYAWTRHKDSYKKIGPFIYTWNGTLFSYQYAHVWFDLRNLVDRDGVNWFQNSLKATLANRQFSIDCAGKFQTFGQDSWGITSMSTPNGYVVDFGAPPTGSGEIKCDGTISPSGPAGSIIFTPKLTLAALKNMYFSYPKLWGQYGLRDSFNVDKNWYAATYYGIAEAMLVMPVENFRSGLIWKNFMKNRHIKEALKKAGFRGKLI